jgi:hypothetical protein
MAARGGAPSFSSGSIWAASLTNADGFERKANSPICCKRQQVEKAERVVGGDSVLIKVVTRLPSSGAHEGSGSFVDDRALTELQLRTNRVLFKISLQCPVAASEEPRICSTLSSNLCLVIRMLS